MGEAPMTDKTPLELIAAEVGSELESVLNDFLAVPGGNAESERRRDALKTVLWDNKQTLLQVVQAYGPLIADLRETLKAALYYFDPAGVQKITEHVLASRKARESNDEIDRLEQILEREYGSGQSPTPVPAASQRRRG